MAIRKPRKVITKLPTKSIHEEQREAQLPVDRAFGSRVVRQRSGKDQILAKDIKLGDYVEISHADGVVIYKGDPDGDIYNISIMDAIGKRTELYKFSQTEVSCVPWPDRAGHKGLLHYRLHQPTPEPSCRVCYDHGYMQMGPRLAICSAVGCQAKYTEKAKNKVRLDFIKGRIRF